MVLPKGKQTKIAPQFSTLPCKSLCQAIDVVNSIRTGDAVRCHFFLLWQKNQFAMAIFHIDMEIFSIEGQKYILKLMLFFNKNMKNCLSRYNRKYLCHCKKRGFWCTVCPCASFYSIFFVTQASSF